MIRALITVSQMFPEGGAVHSQIVEFQSEKELQSAIDGLDRQNRSNGQNSVWGPRYELTVLFRT